MKVLIIQTAFIGDVVLATPVVEKLKEKYPDSTIDFLLRKGNESLIVGNPHIRKVWVFDKKNGKYKNLFRMSKELRTEAYDYVVNLQRFFTTGLMTVLSGGKVKIGFDKNPLSFLFTHAVKHHISHDNTNVHEVNRNLSLIEQIVDDASFKKPRLYPSATDYAVVPSGEEYICIAPSSVWFTKQFAEHKWIELVNNIPNIYKVYLIGAKGDMPLCERIQKATSHQSVEILAGQLTFLQSCALIDKARMTFVNDSAPLHFASAMNAPVVAFFCSTVPAFGFGPLSDFSIVAEVEEKLDCRPCGLHGKKTCPQQHFKCSEMDVKKVLVKAGIL
jgi:heptosyltransferase-2